MNMKTPKWIIVIIILVLFMLYQNVVRLLLGPKPIDFIIADHHSLLWLAIGLIIILIVLEIVWIYVLLTRKKWWLIALYGLFSVDLLYHLLILGLSISSTNIVKELYIQNKLSLWIEISADKMIFFDVMFSPIWMIVTVVLYIWFIWLIIYYLKKKESYFSK